MASIRNVAFINSFIDDVRKTQKNVSALNLKKADRQFRNEQFKLKKNKFEADLKLKEAEGTIKAETASRNREIFKLTEDAFKTEAKRDDLLQNAAGDSLKTKQGNQLGIMRQIQSLTLKEGPSGSTLTRTIKPPTRERRKVTAEDKALGVLQQGGITDSAGTFTDFSDRKEAEAFAASKLGPDFKETFPRADEFINKKFPGKDDFGFNLGEIKSIKGKGEFEYLGDNKWKKVKK